ncbi:hypothetical protein Fmac_019067 [Flemingia macrophylla]|uniref:Uncharacterized protein n=1 Tax=Flemingia macrophylla TaxID=520843 RepID=A0ABD1M6W2_9FABA
MKVILRQSRSESDDTMVITKTEKTLAISIMVSTNISCKMALWSGSIVPRSHSEKYKTIMKTIPIMTLGCATNKASPVVVDLKEMTPNNNLKNLSNISCVCEKSL